MPAETAKNHDMPGFLRSRREEAREEAWDARIGELAGRQHGVVSLGQLRGLGLGRGAIEHRLARGRLYSIFPGAYAVGHKAISRRGYWTGAVLASGPDAVLSHWSAAALWGIRPNSRTRIDVTLPRKSRSWAGVRRHHKALPPDEITVEEGIPVTSPPRTVFDLAATEPVETVESMLREIEYLQLRDRLSLRDLVERYPAHRGVRRVQAALDRLEREPPGRRRSTLEERFAPFIRRHRLPMPRFNDWIVLGTRRFQVDCHWHGTNQIVELDGWQGHGTRSAFRDDRGRDRALSVAGYLVTRLTWSQLDDEPEAVAADLRLLLAVR